MIINVLPLKEKKSLLKEYYLRLVIVCLFLLTALSFLATFLLIPSYVLSKTKVQVLTNSLNSLNNQHQGLSEADLTSSINDINSTLGLLNSGVNSRNIYDQVFSAILSLRPQGVIISQISYAEPLANKNILTLQGIASDRTSLKAFQVALESSPTVSNVDLPISDFTSKTDIDFTITLTMK